MRPIILTMMILAISGFLIATSAQAFDATRRSGLANYSQGALAPCPAGTCNRQGAPKAKDVKFCSAANCKRKAAK